MLYLSVVSPCEKGRLATLSKCATDFLSNIYGKLAPPRNLGNLVNYSSMRQDGRLRACNDFRGFSKCMIAAFHF